MPLDPDFRQLSTPRLIRSATVRSQAIGALRMFGCETAANLSKHFGVPLQTLKELQAEGFLEQSGDWWRIVPGKESEPYSDAS
jgi:hypothetical protein